MSTGKEKFKAYMESMERTPAKMALTHMKDTSKIQDAIALENAFLATQFIRAEGYDTDGMKLFTALKRQIAEAYVKADISKGEKTAMFQVEKGLQGPSDAALAQLFPDSKSQKR